jgi:hypothetical protein
VPLELSGGTPPFRYSLSAGQLPPGLTLDAQSGVLGGKPTQRGEFEFSVTVRDAREQAATRAFVVIVDESAGSESTAPGMEPKAADNERQKALSAEPQAASTGDLSDLLGIISAMPEGDWRRVNLNDYSAVWTPEALRPLYLLSNPAPSKIILAWSSFAWDRTAPR